MSIAHSKSAAKPSAVYQQIRRRIVCLDYQPGSSLDERSLVEEFGTSRTPVREALIRLASEGLIELEKNKGAKVTDLDLITLQSIFEAGDLIERAYTRLACLRRSDADISKILEACDQFDADVEQQNVSAMIESNTAFHLRIASASRNKYFIESYRRILADHERIAQLWYSHNFSSNDHATNTLVCEQHRALVQAIADQDMNLADQLTVEHASLCKEGIRQILSSGESLTSDLVVDTTPVF